MPAIVTLPFVESFDHYNIETSKWMIAGAGSAINLTNSGISRTGIGCCLLTQISGPQLLFPPLARVVFGGAFYPNGAPAVQGDFGQIYDVRSINEGVSQVRIGMYTDGTLVVKNDNDPVAIVIASSAAGVINPAAYNYIEVDAQIAASASVTVKVNNTVVIDVSGVRTRVPGTSAVVNQFELKAIGGVTTGRHDDFYIRDPKAIGQGLAFYGPIRVRVAVAVSDSTPLLWTPSTGTDHFAMVDEIPPDDGTTYVSGDTPNQIDQYLYGISGISNGASIPVVQHSMDAALVGGGSRALGSSCGGIVTGDVQVTSVYNMVIVPYELDPVTGLAWVVNDLSVRPFGPAVTG
jgi:hypothetical protein